MPLTTGTSVSQGNYSNAWDGFQSDGAAYVFGSVTIETPAATGFDGAFNTDQAGFQLHLNIDGSGLTDITCLAFSNQTKCGTGWAGGAIFPDMKSRTWGPVPFITAIDSVFTPKFPEGNPAMDQGSFSLQIANGKVEGDKSFTIGKTW
jgi:hypothetical protein